MTHVFQHSQPTATMSQPASATTGNTLAPRTAQEQVAAVRARTKTVHQKAVERIAAVRTTMLGGTKTQANACFMAAKAWRDYVLRPECLLRLADIEANVIEAWLDDQRQHVNRLTLEAPAIWASQPTMSHPSRLLSR